MPSNNKCAYKGCNNTTKNPEGYTFHRFPKDEKLQLDWILLSGNDNFVNLTPKQIYEKRLCSAHFLPTDFHQSSPNKSRKLLSNVMPIAYEERIDLPQLDNIVNVNNENLNIENINDINVKLIACQAENEGIHITEPEQTNSITIEPAIAGDSETKQVIKSEPLKKTLLNGLKKRDTPKHVLISKIAKLRAKVKAQDSKIRRLQYSSKKMKRKLDPDSIVHYAAKYLNDDQLLFLQMQLNHSKKHAWSEHEKDFALSLYFTSPKAYTLLKDEKNFALPCITLIRQWASNLIS